MGNRASISFQNGKDKSVAFFSHWDGKELFKSAGEFVEKLKKELELNKKPNGIIDPLDRLEPSIVMINFILDYLKGNERVTNNYYLGRNSNDGDNSDNGHRTITL